MRVLAIDQGTTSTRALVADAEGNAEIRLALRHHQHRPRDGWVEHDPLELLGNIERCLAAAGSVDAIGIANQGESCLAWDADTGAPLSPIVVWQDNRTASRIATLRERGGEALTRERAGLPLDAYFSASKLAWLLDNLPAVKKARDAGRLRLGTTDAFFLDRLTGVFATDVTTASRTSLMNLATRQWDARLCALFGVPLEALPKIRASADDFGTLGTTPVTASLVDQQASLYGHGCRQPGDAKITFGTGAFALGVTGERIVRSETGSVTTTVGWQVGDAPVFAMEGGVYDASAAVDWAQRLGLFSDYSTLAQFDATPAIARNLTFVPALSGLACPHWDRSAAALWIGMHGGTTREDLCQALLEGIALRSAEVIGAMDAQFTISERLSIDGGLARSPYFAQFLADVLQRKVVTRHFDELTAFGCAAMAARGLGLELEAPRSVHRCFTPCVTAATAAGWREMFADAVVRSRQWR